MTKNIQDSFKQFCKERHAEDKGRNYDMLQEIYANTEFFDTTLLEVPKIEYYLNKYNSKTYLAEFSLENFALPFQNSFIMIEEHTFIFLREYAPDTLTGTMWVNEFMDKGNSLNIPFTIKIKEGMGIIMSDFYVPLLKNKIESIIQHVFAMVIGVFYVLNNLSKKTIVVDKPSNPNHCEYYRRKRKPTLKIPKKPIYYILGDKSEDTSAKYQRIKATGTLEYSYCFRVRGHWRRINEKRYGKDRNGNYNVQGFTWVTEYTKGEGELAQRVRVIE